MTSEQNSGLQDLRTKIDAADRELLQTLAKRMKFVEEIGAYKREKALDPVDLGRLQTILATRGDWAAELGLSADFVQQLFQLIHKEAVWIEKRT